MEKPDREAVLVELTEKMKEAGSWCGETHLQKCSFFFQTLCEPDLGLPFVMYKHGPFSFELRDELTELRAEGAMTLVPQPAPYGPKFEVTSAGKLLASARREVVETNERGLSIIASLLGPKSVADLERLSTALYIRDVLKAPEDDRVQRLIELKPHVSPTEAEWAYKEVEEISAAFSS
ncbi:MAG: hypothetical protein ACRDH7_08695 [Actinomycetota bacterium]